MKWSWIIQALWFRVRLLLTWKPQIRGTTVLSLQPSYSYVFYICIFNFLLFFTFRQSLFITGKLILLILFYFQKYLALLQFIVYIVSILSMLFPTPPPLSVFCFLFIISPLHRLELVYYILFFQWFFLKSYHVYLAVQ